MAKKIIDSEEDEHVEDLKRVKLPPGRTPPKPFTKADSEAHGKVILANIKANAGKPMS